MHAVLKGADCNMQIHFSRGSRHHLQVKNRPVSYPEWSELAAHIGPVEPTCYPASSLRSYGRHASKNLLAAAENAAPFSRLPSVLPPKPARVKLLLLLPVAK